MFSAIREFGADLAIVTNAADYVEAAPPRRRFAKGSISRLALLRLVFRSLLTLLILGFCIVAFFVDSSGSEEIKRVASGAFGAMVGYWFR